MKIIDENGRLFGKISVIDLLVIALVLVLALALYVKNALISSGNEEEPDLPKQTITIQVWAEAQRPYVFNSLHVGDNVWDPDHFDGENYLGVITAVEAVNDPGTVLMIALDGSVERVEAEGTVDMLVTIECTGMLDGRTYYINDEYCVGINSNRNYATLLSKFSGITASVR